MKFEFKYAISDEEIGKLTDWYNSIENPSIEQHPLWRSSTESSGTYCYFIATEDDAIICSAVITEITKLQTKNASIDFGPLFKDNDALIASVTEIYNYYKAKGFTALTVQLASPTGNDADYIEYRINKKLPVKYYFDRNNWSSTVIDLEQEEDQIMRNMSKGHKSDIKKAIKSGLTVTDTFSEDEFKDFIGLYIKMHEQRGIAENKQGSFAFLNKINSFFKDHNAGKILLVQDNERKILGGILLVHQGNTVRYFKGAADPDIRNLPVLHLAIWEAITRSKKKQFAYFDLWGYNHFVDEKDQVFFINRFKKGFGGYFTFYPKKMYFIFRPLQYKMFNTVRTLHQKLRKK